MVYRVFIAHTEAEEDKPIVDRCIDWLEANNIEYYLAELSLEPDKPLPVKIENAIKTSDCVLLIQTKRGALSTWVQQEAALSRAFTKPTIILLEKGVKVKGLLRDYGYLTLDRSNPDDALQKITDYFVNTKTSKEISETMGAIILGGLALMFIIGLVALAAPRKI